MLRKTVRAVIIYNNQLVTLFRRKNNLEYYSLPGGGIEANETKEEALNRELKEELNIKVKIIKYLFQDQMNDKINYFYLCEYISGSFTLGGEEKEENCYDNYYEISFLPLDKIDDYPLLEDVKR